MTVPVRRGGEPTDDGDLYPSRANSCACSRPTKPPPITTSDAGSSVSSIAVVDGGNQPAQAQGLPARAGLGAGGDEIRLRAHRSSIHEQGSRVCERCSARGCQTRRQRRCRRTLVWRSIPTRSSFCSMSALRSTIPAELGAPENGFVRAGAGCAAARSVLDGTQPTFTQVPPRVPDSMATTLAPPRGAWIAAPDIAARPSRSPGRDQPCVLCHDASSKFEPATHAATPERMDLKSMLEGQVGGGGDDADRRTRGEGEDEGVHAAVLRGRGLLQPPERTPAGYRKLRRRAVQRLSSSTGPAQRAHPRANRRDPRST